GCLSLTTAFLFIFGRAATTDMTLSAPLAVGFMAAYLWWERERARYLFAAAVAVGFAALAKGPVAPVLLGLALLGFSATQRHLRRLLGYLHPLPIAVFFLVAAPWYIAVQIRNPTFFNTFFLQHNLERFATNRFEHPQPFWYYLPLLLLALFPWTGWLGLPLQSAVRRWRRLGWIRAWDGRDQPLKFFLGSWLAAPVIFFSLSHSKLPGYI